MTFEESKQKLAETIKNGYEKDYGDDIDIKDVVSALDFAFERFSRVMHNTLDLDCKFFKPVETNKTDEKL